MASQTERLQNHTQVLQEFLSLEKYLLLQFAHLACICEDQTLPDEMLNDQMIALFDLKKEADSRLGRRNAEADKHSIQSVLSCFPAKP